MATGPTTPRGVILGVDFGTCTSSAAAFINGRIELVLDGGDSVIPSVVYFPEHGDPVVGQRALVQRITEPAHTVVSIKRVLGRSIGDREIKLIDANVGYRFKSGPGQMAILSVRSTDYAPAQIAGLILDRIRTLAEKRFGAVSEVVLAVPAQASAQYKNAVTRAAQLAHLKIREFIPEPLAGALALGALHSSGERRIAICDFGGGTFDVTLVAQKGADFTPLAVHGDSWLGGDDFDEALATAVASHVFHTCRVEMQRDVVRWRELVMRCESIKRQLSDHPEAVLTMKDFAVLGGKSCDLRLPVARAWAETAFTPLVERAVDVLREMFRQLDVRPAEIDEVLLIGGTSQIPLVQRALSDYVGRAVRTSKGAEVAVAAGAATKPAVTMNVK